MASPARPLPAGHARPAAAGSAVSAPPPSAIQGATVDAPRDVVCELIGADAVTHDVRVLRLKVVDGTPFRHRAGQYARIDVPGSGPRFFSIASAPPADGSPAQILEFHVRAAPGGEASRLLHEQVTPGDRLTVHGPLGRACWRPGDERPLLLVGGGTGFAPVLAIAEAAMAAGLTAPVRVYLGVRAERDVYHEDRLRALALAHPGFRYIVALSEPDGAVTGRRQGNIGDLLADDIVRDGPLPRDCQVYLAGPPAMVQATRAVLARLGVDPADVHGDG